MTAAAEIKNHKDRAVALALAAASQGTLAASLMAIVEGWRAEAVSLEGVAKRGSIGRQKELRTGASLLAAVAIDVEKLGPVSDPTATAHNPDPIAEHMDGRGEHASLAQALINATPPPSPVLFPTETGTALAAASVPGSVEAYLTGQTNVYEPQPQPEQPNGAEPVQIFDPQPASPSTAPISVTTDLRPQAETAEAAAPGVTVLNATLMDPGKVYEAPPRLPWSRIPELWEQIEPLDHKSYSQINTAEDCSLRYLLSRAARSKLIPVGRPQWANVGGGTDRARPALQLRSGQRRRLLAGTPGRGRRRTGSPDRHRLQPVARVQRRPGKRRLVARPG
jgi:hypothetical protein